MLCLKIMLHHADCFKGLLVCGHNNCLTEFGKTEDFYDEEDDCCAKLCTQERPCYSPQVMSLFPIGAGFLDVA